MSEHVDISAPARAFLQPQTAKQRQYEALRACFVEQLPIPEVARRFAYTPGTLYVMCSKFRKKPSFDFFLPADERPLTPGKSLPRKRALLEKILALRKQNLSIYDIARALAQDDTPLTPAMISKILKEQGFAKLPRRADDERAARVAPVRAARADVRELDLAPRTLDTQFGGLFLFVPYLAQMPLENILRQAQLPGTETLPALQAMLALLGLKLFGKARTSHVMSAVLDEGLALFAGLNAIPKRSSLTEYSCRIDPACYPLLMQQWFDAVKALGLKRGNSFDLDFHTIPFHGEDALLEKHYISKRSRRQKGVLAFLARDAAQDVFCYANAQIRKKDQNTEVRRFVDFWKTRTGAFPAELVFDSRLTTYAQLSQLNTSGIKFLTLRRRSRKMVRALQARELSAWRQIELPKLSRQYRTPRIIDEEITLRDYHGPVRQISIADLGHEEPTLLLTNYLDAGAATLITRYAERMIIENKIADGIDFFHMDALSSAVAMKVNCDLQLTLMASSLYKLLACEIGQGYEQARTRTVFNDFVDATARLSIGADTIRVAFHKRAHNPYLLATGLAQRQPPIPWLGNRRLELVFG